ncbi:hypothetical protein HYALB_00008923 [Hymenoscyphus albidus]|uniref:Uncharacterized protein n=1 Tax=Hymenoscyphus albidus TaxID=595503 RepID=A0A9N9LML5_9HELO|nr:hypothetical protein HYALB_00008923 [Hymenoscyphus albidus]
MFVPVEPARIREDTVTTPPRVSLGTSPSAAGPGRSTMATTPRHPFAPAKCSSSTQFTKTIEYCVSELWSPSNTTSKPPTATSPHQYPEKAAVQIDQEDSMAQFVEGIADSQLPETPTRAYSQRHPRSRTYANQMKRLSAPAAPVDPITLRTPTYIAQRNRHTNMFDILQDLDVPQPLDNIHEEEGARDGVVLPGPVALGDFAVPATEALASGDRFNVMGFG